MRKCGIHNGIGAYGRRSEVAIKLFGDDLDTLKRTAARIATVASRVPGSQDVKAEAVSGLPEVRKVKSLVGGTSVLEIAFGMSQAGWRGYAIPMSHKRAFR